MVFKDYQNSGDQHNRKQCAEQRGAHQDVNCALAGQPEQALVKTTTENQPARLQRIDADLARLALKKCGCIGHLDSRQLAIEQLLNWEIPGAPVIYRNNDLRNVMSF